MEISKWGYMSRQIVGESLGNLEIGFWKETTVDQGVVIGLMIMFVRLGAKVRLLARPMVGKYKRVFQVELESLKV